MMKAQSYHSVTSVTKLIHSALHSQIHFSCTAGDLSQYNQSLKSAKLTENRGYMSTVRLVNNISLNRLLFI